VVTQSLVFGDGMTLHALPVNYVSAVVDYDGHSELLFHQEQEWPVCTLEQLFEVAHAQTVAKRAVLSLDRYVGGSVLADGRQVLIVNMHRLMQQRAQSLQRGWNPTDAHRKKPSRTALIADDSVTMRVAGERLLQCTQHAMV